MRLADDFSNLGRGSPPRVHVLALDPGIVTGWAFCDATGIPYACGAYGKPGHHIDTGEYIECLFNLFRLHGHAHVVLYEDLLIMPGRQRSLSDARPRIAIEAFAYANAIPWQSVNVATWKAFYHFPRKPRPDDLYSVRLANSLFPSLNVPPKAHDVADAALMAAYFAHVVNQPPMPKQLALPKPSKRSRSKLTPQAQP